MLSVTYSLDPDSDFESPLLHTNVVVLWTNMKCKGNTIDMSQMGFNYKHSHFLSKM